MKSDNFNIFFKKYGTNIRKFPTHINYLNFIYIVMLLKSEYRYYNDIFKIYVFECFKNFYIEKKIKNAINSILMLISCQ